MQNINRLLSNRSILLANKHSVQILSWSSAGLAGISFVFLAVIFFVTPGRTDTATASQQNAAVSSASVVMKPSGFSPVAIRVARGTQVVWTNSSNSRITISSGKKGGPSSGDSLDPGDSYTYTAATAGTFTYHANGHDGTVVVQ